MKRFTDQMGREIFLPSVPKRIVSLVPSQTELLADLGLGDKVVGITKFCIHPKQWKQEKAKVGGTKKIDREKILRLNPDLCIGNKEENAKEDIEWLSEHFPVWMSDVNTFEDALEMIQQFGGIFECEEQAASLIQDVNAGFGQMQELGRGRSVIYYIWHNPDYAVGPHTFIHDILHKLGLQNLVTTERYPEIGELQIEPDLIFLSSEPFPFREDHLELWRKKSPLAQVILVDGEMFSWYGSRMRLAPNYFKLLFDQIG